VSDPQTPEAWQRAVDDAWDALISGKPGTDYKACGEILDRGRKLGYRPPPARVIKQAAAFFAAASPRIRQGYRRVVRKLRMVAEANRASG